MVRFFRSHFSQNEFLRGCCYRATNFGDLNTFSNLKFNAMAKNRDSQDMGSRVNGNTSNRGFASMDPQRQREIASEGGRAAHEKGTAHEFDSNEAIAAGRKGGEAVSQNREHMAEIGRKGGQSSGNSRRQNHQSESEAA
jgi:general stress protein YciG